MDKYKRIVIKIGTAVIADKSGQIDPKTFSHLVDQIIALHKESKEIILVSSGAVGAGRKFLDLRNEKEGILKKQTLAALGQSYLMKDYIELFDKENILVAQALLMRRDFIERDRYLNSIGTLSRLLENKVIPIINENDVIATEELGFGDNDGLAAMTAVAMKADLLIILSTVKGLYTCDPKKEKKAELLGEVKEFKSELFKMCEDKKESISFGGMITKLKAARVATIAGVTTYIASGQEKGSILKIVEGKNIGTKFLPSKRKEKDRDRWLLAGLTSFGGIVVDNGAKEALLKNKSLLAVGVVNLKNTFRKGDLIEMYDQKDSCFAAGVIRVSSEKVEKMLSLKKEGKIKEIKNEFKEEIIHIDDIILL